MQTHKHTHKKMFTYFTYFILLILIKIKKSSKNSNMPGKHWDIQNLLFVIIYCLAIN